MKEKYTELNVLHTPFNATEASKKFNHPFDSAASAGQWRWCWDQSLACCAPLGRSEFSQATGGQNSPECSAHREFSQVSWGHGWTPSSASGGPGIGGSGDGVGGNEVMAQGLQRSPSALPGPEAPSHLCAVWPSGRQLLPLIIPPNGWIRFPLTSSCLHNNIPPSLRSDTPFVYAQTPFFFHVWSAEQAQLGLQWKQGFRLQPTNYSGLIYTVYQWYTYMRVQGRKTRY